MNQATFRPARKPRVFAAPKLDPAKPLIDAMLREDLTAHRKQQHTARRVLGRLVDEHAVDDVSYASVRDYVARRRPKARTRRAAGWRARSAGSRRNHLVPQPDVATLAELNARLERADQTDLARRIENRTRTVGHDLALERPLLRALPADGFDPGLSLTPRVDRYARVMVRQCQYSVPARLIGWRVWCPCAPPKSSSSTAASKSAGRSVRKGSAVLLLEHYLEVLARKPGALPGATALAQAGAAGTFTSAHDAF